MKMKKINIFKIVLSVLLIILLIICIHTIRNGIIINKLYKKQNEIKESKNYSYISEHYTTESSKNKNKIEHYHKEGIDKLVLNEGNIIMWYDSSSKENIVIDTSQKVADVSTSDFLVGSDFPIYINDTKKSVGSYITSKITNDEIDGIKCYKVEDSEQTVWIDKEKGMILKILNKNERKNEVVEYKEWKFDVLKDDEMTKPELEGYEIIE